MDDRARPPSLPGRALVLFPALWLRLRRPNGRELGWPIEHVPVCRVALVTSAPSHSFRQSCRLQCVFPGLVAVGWRALARSRSPPRSPSPPADRSSIPTRWSGSEPGRSDGGAGRDRHRGHGHRDRPGHRPRDRHRAPTPAPTRAPTPAPTRSRPRARRTTRTAGSKAASCDGFDNDQTGVTADTINLVNVADISGPVPGIFESAQQGTRAFLEYFNSTEDICGHKLDARPARQQGRRRRRPAGLRDGLRQRASPPSAPWEPSTPAAPPRPRTAGCRTSGRPRPRPSATSATPASAPRR